MLSQSVTPDHIRILRKVGAQHALDPWISDCATFDRFNQKAGIIDAHLSERSTAATVAIEGNAPQENTSFLIAVEVGEYTVILQAEAEAARPGRHGRGDPD